MAGLPEEPLSVAATRSIPGGGSRAWLVLYFVSTAALSVLAVHLPPATKLLALFAAAFGLCDGWIAARLASWLGVRPGARSANRTGWTALVFAVILAGEVGIAAESHRLRRAHLPATPRADSSALSALRLLDSQSVPDDPKSRQYRADIRQKIEESLDADRQRIEEERSFSGYLRHRVLALGPRAQRFAAWIWGGEIILGSLAGAWLFARLVMYRRSAPPGQPL